MKNIYTQSNYNISNKIISIGIWELVFYLTTALIIGYLIHYIFSKRRDYVRTPKKKPSFYYNDALNSSYYPNSEPIYPNTIVQSYEAPVIKQEFSTKENNYELYNGYENKQKQNFVVAESQNHISQKDDLKIIEGIGPKIEEILNRAKIKTWYQLSKTQIEKLKSILMKEGKRFQMHDPSTWPEQAHLAETRQWSILKEFQDSLNGGKL